MTAAEAAARWNVKNTTKTLSQMKVTSTPIFDKYFRNKAHGILGSTTTIKIMKGSGMILQSVAPDAEHLIHERPTLFEIAVKLPRFALENNISASTLNEISSLDDPSQPIQLASEVGTIQKEHRLSFDTTIEYMSTGALFGKVMDGTGKTLFEFASTRPQVEFKTGKKLLDSITEIDDAMVEELGMNPGYVIKCGRGFYNHVMALAEAEDLFTKKLASIVTEGETIFLVVHGRRFEAYTVKYQNTQGQLVTYVGTNEMAAIPNSDTFTDCIYGRADHTAAVKSPPTLFFGSTEELPKGRGVSVLSETKPLPVCLNPNAVIRGKKL
ncbi:major capsid protein [Sulfuricurvum sp.]|uniref:major capsid protein n=1 Tax=Sulfuricurvum sp. TaxID=2025608 RepID=UPI002630D34D|nr:major capsid protein [Sulfuricurvum sp.]MDD2267024.1 major capsid protein [Sulfuricurvum sp.]MDD2782640.1 major capsid protein [Sulfuricurvum sp.]